MALPRGALDPVMAARLVEAAVRGALGAPRLTVAAVARSAVWAAAFAVAAPPPPAAAAGAGAPPPVPRPGVLAALVLLRLARRRSALGAGAADSAARRGRPPQRPLQPQAGALGGLLEPLLPLLAEAADAEMEDFGDAWADGLVRFPVGRWRPLRRRRIQLAVLEELLVLRGGVAASVIGPEEVFSVADGLLRQAVGYEPRLSEQLRQMLESAIWWPASALGTQAEYLVRYPAAVPRLAAAGGCAAPAAGGALPRRESALLQLTPRAGFGLLVHKASANASSAAAERGATRVGRRACGDLLEASTCRAYQALGACTSPASLASCELTCGGCQLGAACEDLMSSCEKLAQLGHCRHGGTAASCPVSCGTC
ncbi:unnamed protein product [Prorocentrum cordatum]|uniref:ShKT domain-containing protein n=1 Tax=Prorocentrum cordatum TaxID=2364126 RepID=A0ABN9TD61_9DINO|nr:unnamed protein product [Polarella glacialis]